MKNGISFYRKKRELTGNKTSQLDLAEVVGVPRSRISMLENGEAIPKPRELERIAKFLEVTPGHLYSAKQIELIYEDEREDAKLQEQEDARAAMIDRAQE